MPKLTPSHQPRLLPQGDSSPAVGLAEGAQHSQKQPPVLFLLISGKHPAPRAEPCTPGTAQGNGRESHPAGLRVPSALTPLPCQLLHPTGCRARREGSRQGQGSQGKEMKTSPFNINCMFSCPCLIYTPRFCLLSEQQCLSCRAQPSAAARSSIRFFCAFFKHYLGRVFSL